MQNRSYLKRSRRQGKAGTACCHHWPQDGVRLFLPNGGHCKGATVDEFHRSFLPDFSLKSPSAYMWKCRATMRKSSPEKRITIRSWVSMNVHSFASGSRTRLTVLGAIGPQKVEQGQSQQRQSVHALAQQVLELVFVLEQLEHVAHLRVTLKWIDKAKQRKPGKTQIVLEEKLDSSFKNDRIEGFLKASVESWKEKLSLTPSMQSKCW